MFKIKFQKAETDRRGVTTYNNLPINEKGESSIVVNNFDEKLASRAMEAQKPDNGVRVSLYIDLEDPVPQGYAHKDLAFSKQIWKQQICSVAEAAETLNALPF